MLVLDWWLGTTGAQDQNIGVEQTDVELVMSKSWYSSAIHHHMIWTVCDRRMDFTEVGKVRKYEKSSLSVDMPRSVRNVIVQLTKILRLPTPSNSDLNMLFLTYLLTVISVLVNVSWVDSGILCVCIC